MKRALFLSFITIITISSFAQLGGIKDKLLAKDPLKKVFEKPPPITTSLTDAKWETKTVSETYGNDTTFRDMYVLQRTPNGGFVVQPGFYSYTSESYCLKAGTHGPGGGSGYIYAPPLGKAEEHVKSIVRNSVNHPEIHQRDIQTLLWAIIARAKFEDLSTEHKAVAARLLTPRQLTELNRSATDMVPDAVMNEAISKAPTGVREVLVAEQKLRSMLTNPGSTFAEIERVAVLSGNAPLGEGSIEVPSGRWSLHPDGYYVRYIPSGYSSTHIQIWVPQGSSAVGKEFDPATHIAVPGNTARQRLIQSGRKKEQ